MNLVLALIALWMVQGGFFVGVTTTGNVIASLGMLISGVLQPTAIWYFRASIPSRGLAGVRVVPPFRVLALWTLFAVVGAAVFAALAHHYVPPKPVLEAKFRLISAYWAGGLILVAVGPLVEEIVFNACILELLRLKLATPVALLVAAALFGLAHGDLAAMPVYVVGGLVSGIAYVRSGSIIPGYIGHAVGNAYASFG